VTARSAPRISVSKMAEYLVATPARRRAIVRDQKFPKAYKAALYTEAYDVIARSMQHGGDVAVIDAAVASWRSRTPRDAFDGQNLGLWCDAALAFKELAAVFDFASYQCAPTTLPAQLVRGGTAISVRPNLLVTGPAPGAIKIYLGKTHPLTDDEDRRPGSGSYAATLLHEWVAEAFGEGPPSACLVVDVFAGKVHVAPRAFRRRRSDVAAAAEEIATVWASLHDPVAAAPF
jgi:hypothetical protein